MVEPGPDRTEDAIIKESVLIGTFRTSYLTLEKNLILSYLSTHHTDPDMTVTYQELHEHMREHKPYTFTKGRTTCYLIPNVMDAGLAYIEATGATAEEEGEEDSDVESTDSGEATEGDEDTEDMEVDEEAEDSDEAAAGSDEAPEDIAEAAEAVADDADVSDPTHPPRGPDDEIEPELEDIVMDLDM